MEVIARAICAANGYAFGGGIAEGSFKETYLAVMPTGKKVALKLLKPNLSSARTSREVEAMKRCSHPNIAALLVLADFDHGGNKHTYLMEPYMEGGTLADRLEAGVLDRDPLLKIGDVLIGAVCHIADLDLVHRDLKPANIMFSDVDSEPVIGDFGLVRDLRQGSITESHLSMGPGTPYFAAPEQLNNEKALIDWRTDQFALGITLAFAHFGFHPYAEIGDDVGKTVDRAATRKGPSTRFAAAAAASRLPTLEMMVAAWPALRVRTPKSLAEQWKKQ